MADASTSSHHTQHTFTILHLLPAHIGTAVINIHAFLGRNARDAASAARAAGPACGRAAQRAAVPDDVGPAYSGSAPLHVCRRCGRGRGRGRGLGRLGRASSARRVAAAGRQRPDAGAHRGAAARGGLGGAAGGARAVGKPAPPPGGPEQVRAAVRGRRHLLRAGPGPRAGRPAADSHRAGALRSGMRGARNRYAKVSKEIYYRSLI